MDKVMTTFLTVILATLAVKFIQWMFGIELQHIVIPIVFILGFILLIGLTPTPQVILGYICMALIVGIFLYDWWPGLKGIFLSLIGYGGGLPGLIQWFFVTLVLGAIVAGVSASLGLDVTKILVTVMIVWVIVCVLTYIGCDFTGVSSGGGSSGGGSGGTTSTPGIINR